MNRIFNVKQAAKVIGVSTNTMYKYLNEGRITAARGQTKGTFRIPLKSLETFLGSKITDDLLENKKSSENSPAKTIEPNETLIQVSPPTIANRIARILLLICLLLVIGDIVTTKTFSFANQISRLSLISIFLLLTYQFGGFVKK